MPGTDDDELTEEERAIDEYENSKEGKARSKDWAKAEAEAGKSRSAQLNRLFLQTPEMKECQLFAETIANKLDEGDTVSIAIEIPKQFVRLIEFLEQKRTAAGGVARPANKVLTQILVNELHDELHSLVVGPLRFDYYRKLWNRFCDEQGAPEEKIPDPMLAPEKKVEGPF